MKNDQWQTMIAFGLTLSAWVAGPIIVAYAIGSWIDERYNTAPWWLLTCIGIAFIISNVGIVREARKLLRNVDNNKTNNQNNT